jgi:hypothetical protein
VGQITGHCLPKYRGLDSAQFTKARASQVNAMVVRHEFVIVVENAGQAVPPKRGWLPGRGAGAPSPNAAEEERKNHKSIGNDQTRYMDPGLSWDRQTTQVYETGNQTGNDYRREMYSGRPVRNEQSG